MGSNPFLKGLRRLSCRPVFTTAAVLLIAGTTAITVTVAAVARPALFDALPYPDEQRLVALYWSKPELGIPDMSLSLHVTRELPQRTSAFATVAATLSPLSATLMGPDGPSHLTAGLAMPQAFGVLGIVPALGRAFRPEEGEPGSAPGGVILSHEAWQSRFEGDPEVLGVTLVIDGRPWRVIGVLPARRSLAPEQDEPIDIWFPMGAVEEILGTTVFGQPGAQYFRVNARLSEGTTVDRLPAELLRLQEALAADYPATHEGWLLHADPLRERILGDVDGPVTALLLGSLLLTGVALTNLMGLFLQRSYEGRSEIATRIALGATPARIRQLRAADAALVGGIGGLSGVAGAAAALGWLRAADPLELPVHIELGFGPSGVLLAMGLALGGTLAVALAASLVPGSGHPSDLRPGGPMAAGTSSGRAAHVALLLQVALTTALAIGAVAAGRSLHELRNMDTGLRQEGILSAHMEVPTDLYSAAESAPRARQIVANMRALPDVEDAFLWSPEMPSDAHTFTGLRIEGKSTSDGQDTFLARYHSISPGAATAFGLRFVAGRDMSDDDWNAGRRVALVSASAAVTWWGSVDQALGRRIQRRVHDDWSEVIGVIADASFSGRYGPGSDNVLDVLFMFDQDPRRTFLFFATPKRGQIRLEGLRAAAAAVIPELPLYDVRWIEDRLRDQERPHRNTAGFTSLYALASLLLSIVGMAGSAAVLVNRRRTEIGLRRALGASPGIVMRQLLAGGLPGLSIGVGVGLLLARLGLSLIDPVVLTVGAADPFSYAAGALVVAASALVAMSVPPLTSLRQSPADCLRPAARM